MKDSGGEDSFVDAFDSILSSTDKLNISINNKEDLTMSLKVRRKYGLDDNSNSDHTQSYEALFRSIDEELGNYPKNNPNSNPFNKSQRNYEKEIAIMQAVLQLITRKLMDELVRIGQPVENEHPLLDPLLAVIELILYHGYIGTTEDILTTLFKKRSPNLWTFIESIENNPSTSANSLNAIENVRQFSMLSTVPSKVRAWIRLGLLNKCIGIDLQSLINRERKKKKEMLSNNLPLSSSSSSLSLFFDSLWEEWSCIRSDTMVSLCNLLNSLDAIDFNLYIREQDISTDNPELPWERIFQYDDRIDFLCIKPIIRVPADFYINYFSREENGSESTGNRSNNDLDGGNKDLKKLRKALVSQINQRTYFEQECNRLNKRLVSSENEIHALKLRLKEVLKREKSMIEREKEREERMKLASPLLRTSPSMDAISKSSVSVSGGINPLSLINVTKSADYLYQSIDREQQWKTRERELLQQIEILTQIKEEYKQRLKSNK